jgi:hypothetical protein
MRKPGFCKLHQCDETLVQAHVIPRAFFELHNEKSNSERPQSILRSDGSAHPKKSLIGVYDKSLWCQKAEDSVSQYDDYAIQIYRYKHTKSNLLLDVDSNIIKTQFGPLGYIMPSFDYERFLKFVLSLIWRASVSHQEGYQKMKIVEENELRDRILNDYDVRNFDVEVLVEKFTPPRPGTKIILEPSWQSIGGFNYIRFMFGGFRTRIYPRSDLAPSNLKRFFLSSNLGAIYLTPFKGSPEQSICFDMVVNNPNFG